MTDSSETERYVKNPSLLIDLCRQVIERLDLPEEDKEISSMEAQLREIAKTIKKLEKMGVDVPESLRAEKTRIAAALGMKAEVAHVLIRFGSDLEELLDDLRARLSRDTTNTGRTRGRRKRSTSPKTDKAVIREHIIRALRKLGGTGKVRDVLDEMEEQLKGRLLPGDLEWRESANTYAWRNSVCWERHRMVQDGVLKSDSPRGIWELSEDKR